MSALERYQDHLNIFANWLNLHTLESAAAHVAEAATLATATETLVNRVIEQIHNYDPPVTAGAAGEPACWPAPKHHKPKEEPWPNQ